MVYDIPGKQVHILLTFVKSSNMLVQADQAKLTIFESMSTCRNMTSITAFLLKPLFQLSFSNFHCVAQELITLGLFECTSDSNVI